MSYLCVDGGQTKTSVSLLDASGEQIVSWKAGPLTTPSKPGALESLREVIAGIAGELSAKTEKMEFDPPEAACFSLSGYLEQDERVPSLVREQMRSVMPDSGKIYTIPDYVGNWAAATAGHPGVVVISGGGAVAYGRSASGKSLRVGGWGHLLGDEGSGYWIGLESIKASLKARAGVEPETELWGHVSSTFETEDDRKILADVYSGSFSEEEIAGLVPTVVSLAREGDRTCDRILDEAAGHLARLAAATLDALGLLPVYLSGGVFGAPTMQRRFESSLSGTGRETRVEAVRAEPLAGIFSIARAGLA